MHIYYRGGKILDIKPEGQGFSVTIDKDYSKVGDLSELPPKIFSEENANQTVAVLPKLKQVLDLYFTKFKDRAEREFQQLIVRENNYSIVSNSTDYFIVDIEYQVGKSRFDLLALKWESDGNNRKATGLKITPPTLAICELKYYTRALDGKSGLLSHVEAVVEFLSKQENVEFLKQEVISIFKQKRKLHLVEFGSKRNENSVDELSNNVELILMLANYDPECSKLKTAFDKIEKVQGIDIKIAVANFLGYGLYKESIYDIENFKSRFSSQIYCRNKS